MGPAKAVAGGTVGPVLELGRRSLARVWMGVKAKAGARAGRSTLLVAAAHLRGSCVPRTPLVPWLKPVALNQLRLLCLKGKEGLL